MAHIENERLQLKHAPEELFSQQIPCKTTHLHCFGAEMMGTGKGEGVSMGGGERRDMYK